MCKRKMGASDEEDGDDVSDPESKEAKATQETGTTPLARRRAPRRKKPRKFFGDSQYPSQSQGDSEMRDAAPDEPDTNSDENDDDEDADDDNGTLEICESDEDEAPWYVGGTQAVPETGGWSDDDDSDEEAPPPMDDDDDENGDDDCRRRSRRRTGALTCEARSTRVRARPRKRGAKNREACGEDVGGDARGYSETERTNEIERKRTHERIPKLERSSSNLGVSQVQARAKRVRAVQSDSRARRVRDAASVAFKNGGRQLRVGRCGAFPITTFRLPDRPDYPDCLLIHITRD